MKCFKLSFSCMILMIIAISAKCSFADDNYKILFIGNSFTNQGPIPELVRQLAVSAGCPAPDVTNVAVNGQTLRFHSTNDNTLKAIDKGGWDYVVLQEYSTKATENIGNPSEFKADAVVLYDRVKKSSPKAHIVLYETWARHEKFNIYPKTFTDRDQMQTQVIDNYHDCAERYIPLHSTSKRNTDVSIAPAGQAWHLNYHLKNVMLHGSDLYHAGNTGRYLNASIIFSTIYKHSARGLKPLLDIDADNIAYLQLLSDIVTGFYLPKGDNLNSFYDFTRYDKQANMLLNQMTLDEKIGQMIQAEQSHLKDITDVENYNLGSILSGGSCDPKEGNHPQAWADFYENMQVRTSKTRLKIPLLYGIDAVHGHSNVEGAVIFPHNIGLGCTRNPVLIEKIANITAEEMRGTGIHWTFAPCITVPQDEHWGRTYEGFSKDPVLVSGLGAAAVLGLQGDSLDSPFSVLGCAKHYLGDGGTAKGTSKKGTGWDQGDTQVSEKELRDIHLYPYPLAVKAGVGSIMPSYSSWNGEKCSGSKYLLTDVLKNELGFQGFLISDYEAIKQIDNDFKKSIEISINAGMDMVMEPYQYRVFFKLLKELVVEGKVPVSRIDDAVRRILRVKYAMGMFEPDYNYKHNKELLAQVGSKEHRAVARQAVRESMVLLKNNNKVLPLSKELPRIHVSGKSADNIGLQCGGWTIHWGGKEGKVTTGGTTVLQAIKDTVSSNTKITYSKDGSGVEGADVAIVVIGEKPYAEFRGDSDNLNLHSEDRDVILNITKTGVPVVVVTFTGRPLIIKDVIDEVDGFISGWLPGTEGQGVADVIFGDYNPTGRLSCTWPRSEDQIPINGDTEDENPLYPLGFGLSY